MSSYNLRPRKNIVDYRVLNGYKSKTTLQTSSAPDTQPVETFATEEIQPIVKKPELKIEVVPPNKYENMDLETRKKRIDSIDSLREITKTLDNERNVDKRAELVLCYFHKMYRFIVDFRDYNDFHFKLCNKLSRTYLMKYKELNHQIIQYCFANKKYKELENFHVQCNHLNNLF
jgi:hypothetical protein